MSVCVAVLSDIHLEVGKGNPIPNRASDIAAAISSSATDIRDILLVLSGDIANGGLEAEFALAGVFLIQLREHLTRRLPHVVITIVTVPGNHDCILPKEGERHRAAQVESSLKAMLEADPDPLFVSDLMAVQNNFWAFASQNTNPTPAELADRLCVQYILVLDGYKVQINLINSAIMSQRHESRAYLYLPTQLIKRKLTLQADVHFAISILHHPPFWIEPTNMTSLRQILQETSDLVITGHEHFNSAYSQTQSSGEEVAFFESPALYDPKFPTVSAFGVFIFNFQDMKQQQIIYRWKDGLYRTTTADSSVPWTPIVINRVSRHSFDISTEHMAKLSDVGVAYIHPDSTNITLSELFVYPDLRIEDSTTSNPHTFRSNASLKFLSECGVLLLQGGTFSGKTALLKSVCLDGNTVLGLEPVS